MIGGFALTETLAGSDSFNLRTRAHFDGSEWMLLARSSGSQTARLQTLFRFLHEQRKESLDFVVETKSPGFSAGPPEKKMGIRGSVTAAISFENVRVPKENMMGEDGRGFLDCHENS